MKKILLSIASMAMVGGVAFAATSAFFSDTETSTGNVLAAGELDLGIDNDSYYNGAFNTGTSWLTPVFDLDEGQAGGAYLFYNFSDLKPGDYGEDTISLHIRNNDAWVCADTTLTLDDDVDCSEPELDDETVTGCDEPDVVDDPWDGELADEIEIMWWADDGDNILENDETPVLNIGSLGAAPQGTPVTVTIADSVNNIFSGVGDDPLEGGDTGPIHYIGKAWCFGDLTPVPLVQDNANTSRPDGNNDGVNGPGTPEDGGFTCTGADVISNASQTDEVNMDVAFRAVQSINNADFTCVL